MPCRALRLNAMPWVSEASQENLQHDVNDVQAAECPTGMGVLSHLNPHLLFDLINWVCKIPSWHTVALQQLA